MIPPLMNIEPLETRIAPAAVFTFTDTDGDLVTVKTSKGTNADLGAVGVLTFNTAANVPRQLQKIDLSNNAIFNGTDLTVTATRVGTGGDGVTAVGFLDASTVGGGAALNLGTIAIDGDLGRLLAGTGGAVQAVKTFTAGSLGLLGTTTQAAGGDLISTLSGGVGTFTVKTDLVDARVTAAKIDILKVGGSLLRGAIFTGQVKTISVGGDMIGGAVVDSGSIFAGEVGTFALKGSLVGGPGIGSGRFFPGKVGTITIGGDIRAGTIIDSGKIENNGASVGSIVVRGSIFSDALSGSSSGNIGVGNVGTVLIGGSIVSQTTGAGSLFVGVAKAVTVNGSIDGGHVETGAVGALIIRGSLVGGATDASGSVKTGTVKTVFVGGDLRGGGGGAISGGLFVGGNVDAVEIRGSIIGGTADIVSAIPNATLGGQLEITGAVKTFKLTGDLRGGAGDNSGIVSIGGNGGAVTISGRIVGNSFAAGSTGGGRFFSGGKIASFALGGDLVGDGTDSGKILANGGFGSLRIGGDVLGGAGSRSGVIDGNGILSSPGFGALLIGGSVRGGDGNDSGVLDLKNVGTKGATILIRGSVLGGDGLRSGLVGAEGAFSSAVVEGSVIGGDGPESGRFVLDNQSSVAIASVVVKGDLRGGGAEDSGVVLVGGRVTAVTVLGDVVGGLVGDSGSLQVDGTSKTAAILIGGSVRGGGGFNSGTVFADDVTALTVRGNFEQSVQGGFILAARVGKLAIGGSVLGTAAGTTAIQLQSVAEFMVGGSIVGDDGAPLVIAVVDLTSFFDTNPSKVLIGKLTVGGSVRNARILAGLEAVNTIENSDAQIGLVTVGGDWIASDLVAGIAAGAGNRFGDTNDAFVVAPGDNAALFSRIGAVVIGGRVRGTAAAGDHFGFVAQQIGSFKLAGVSIALTLPPAKDVIEIGNTGVAATNDVTLREV